MAFVLLTSVIEGIQIETIAGAASLGQSQNSNLVDVSRYFKHVLLAIRLPLYYLKAQLNLLFLSALCLGGLARYCNCCQVQAGSVC